MQHKSQEELRALKRNKNPGTDFTNGIETI